MSASLGAASTADDVLAGYNLAGRRYLVTGVTSGIGLETARALAARGASVVGTVRNRSYGEAATDQVRVATNTAGGRFDLIELDLASLRSVRDAANALVKTGLTFDAVIANAGIMAAPFARTVEGFESQLASNYLGHFVLVNGISNLIATGGRVIILSSQAHRGADVDLDDLNFDHQAYDPWLAYSRSKTATTLFAVELDHRLKGRGIRAAAVMPGNSFTALPRHLSQDDLLGLVEMVGKARADDGLPPGELKDITQAAATSVWAAVVADKDSIGGRYLEDCAIAPINDSANPFADGVRSFALDPDRARQLWAKSEALLGISV